MMFKEDLTPNTADPLIYKLAPFISLICAMGTFAIIPFTGDRATARASVGDVNAGILFIFALTSIGVYGISLAGWASGSKFPLLGSVRSTAQMISYELSMSMSVIGVLILAGSTSLATIVIAQARVWFIIPQIIGFVIYLITAVAETNRAPFDLVEAETELVGGFHTEYSGLRFGLFFIAEYLNMITVSCLATLLFLGGWNPLFGPAGNPWLGLVWFLLKAGAVSVLLYLVALDVAALALRSPDGLRLEGAVAGGDAQPGPHGRHRRGTGINVDNAQESLQRHGARQGLRDDVSLHVREEADDRVPVGEEAARAALPRPARAAPLRATAKSAASAASCARSRARPTRSP